MYGIAQLGSAHRAWPDADVNAKVLRCMLVGRQDAHPAGGDIVQVGGRAALRQENSTPATCCTASH